MGTIFTIDLYAADEATASRLAAAAFDEVDRLEALLSNYQPSSELSRISREAAYGPVTTDPETFSLIERSLYWSQRSEGAFDITVGPLLRAWGFFFHEGRVPSSEELAGLQHTIGWRNILLNPSARTVYFQQRHPMELDPGSIGKGFAVDQVVALLKAEGVAAAFISAGGSTLYGLGTPPGGSGWPVDIPDPRQPHAASTSLMLRDTSLSTGGCTEKFFIKDGHRYCHIFDPRTGRPVEGTLQATVIAASATDSDALSTVAFVLGPKEVRTFFEALPDSRVLIYAQPASGPSCTALHWLGTPCQR